MYWGKPCTNSFQQTHDELWQMLSKNLQLDPLAKNPHEDQSKFQDISGRCRHPVTGMGSYHSKRSSVLGSWYSSPFPRSVHRPKPLFINVLCSRRLWRVCFKCMLSPPKTYQLFFVLPNACTGNTHTHTHTCLMALFQDYLGKPVPQR